MKVELMICENAEACAYNEPCRQKKQHVCDDICEDPFCHHYQKAIPCIPVEPHH